MKFNKSDEKRLVSIILLSLISFSYSFDCDNSLGCLIKQKFYGYVSSIDNMGKPHDIESNVNFKNVFVFRDKITFFKAALPEENVPEQEVPNLNAKMNEAHIERVIPFRYLPLECGKFQTRICHAKELPAIAKSEPYKNIKAKISNADDLCIAFTFYEEAYKVESEKIAILCIVDPRQTKELLSFKNFLSRTVARLHLLEANNRYDSSSGLLSGQGKFITFINNKPTPVFATFKSKSIMLTTDDDKREFVKNIMLLGLKNSGAYSLRKASELGKLKEGWADSFSAPPPLDCCIALPNDEGIDVLCIPNSAKKKEIESKKEKCGNQITTVLKSIWLNLRKIQFAERLSKLVTDHRASGNCASKEFQIFKAMVIEAGKDSITLDCKILVNYSLGLPMTKQDYCLKHYIDEMEMMMRLIALGHQVFWNKLKDCVYHKFGFDFTDKYILSNKFNNV